MRQNKAVKGIKLPAGVTPEFYDSIQAKTTDELKSLIVQLQVQGQETDALKSSEAFQEAKAQLDLIAGPIRETKTSLKNRTQLVLERLKEKGGA